MREKTPSRGHAQETMREIDLGLAAARQVRLPLEVRAARVAGVNGGPQRDGPSGRHDTVDRRAKTIPGPSRP